MFSLYTTRYDIFIKLFPSYWMCVSRRMALRNHKLSQSTKKSHHNLCSHSASFKTSYVREAQIGLQTLLGVKLTETCWGVNLASCDDVEIGTKHSQRFKCKRAPLYPKLVCPPFCLHVPNIMSYMLFGCSLLSIMYKNVVMSVFSYQISHSRDCLLRGHCKIYTQFLQVTPSLKSRIWDNV